MERAEFDMRDALAVLERTPATLAAMLTGVPETWARATEGEGTWSPYDVVGHLVHGEHTDWIRRARHILSGEPGPFAPFDRTAMFAESEGKTLDALLAAFAELRASNLAEIRTMGLGREDFARTGMHPALGEVTLGQLLATWVVHDLDHVAQISRVMAKVYAEAVGPWEAYLSILRDRRE
jgi:uncharacterized damage-inducible protein DinB